MLSASRRWPVTQSPVITSCDVPCMVLPLSQIFATALGLCRPVLLLVSCSSELMGSIVVSVANWRANRSDVVTDLTNPDLKMDLISCTKYKPGFKIIWFANRNFNWIWFWLDLTSVIWFALSSRQDCCGRVVIFLKMLSIFACSSAAENQEHEISNCQSRASLCLSTI